MPHAQAPRLLLLACLLVPAVSVAQRPPDAGAPGAALILRAPRCLVGGAVPALFVDLEVHTDRPVTGLSATRFELRPATGTWVSGSEGPLTLRELRGMTPGGAFDLRPFNGALAAGSTLRLQVFGRLALAAYGRDAGYPDRPLAFRVLFTDGAGRHWEVTGAPCVVGPAG